MSSKRLVVVPSILIGRPRRVARAFQDHSQTPILPSVQTKIDAGDNIGSFPWLRVQPLVARKATDRAAANAITTKGRSRSPPTEKRARIRAGERALRPGSVRQSTRSLFPVFQATLCRSSEEVSR